MTPIKQGDTVEKIRTGEIARVVSMSPSILTLEADQKQFNDAARYWRPICPK